MEGIIYFFLVFFACTFGAISGIGGGIIIKPVMDAMGGFSVSTINALSSITVLTMTTVSVIRTRANARHIEWQVVSVFIVGSIIGGIIGYRLLEWLLVVTEKDSVVSVIQSIMQIVLVVAVILIQIFDRKLPHYRVKSKTIMLTIGLILGIVASFLGIGGGIFNKAVLVILLSMVSRAAAYTSLCIIFCSQGASVITMGFSTHFANVDFVILPFMMVGAIAGGFFGSYVATHVNDKIFDRLFMLTLYLILMLNIFNLIRSLAI